jgi:hypothetical protein
MPDCYVQWRTCSRGSVTALRSILTLAWKVFVSSCILLACSFSCQYFVMENTVRSRVQAPAHVHISVDVQRTCHRREACLHCIWAILHDMHAIT